MTKNIFEDEVIGGIFTSVASEKALAKNWLSKSEKKAWKHLENEM